MRQPDNRDRVARMASQNVELVRSICTAWERGKFGGVEWAHSEIEYVQAGPGPAPGTWTGIAGMAEGWRDFMEAWENFRIDVDEYRELDQERVLAFVYLSGRGKTSGLDFGRRPAVSLFHVRGGKVTRLVNYADVESATADLGLEVRIDVPRTEASDSDDPEYALSSSSEEEHSRLLRQAEWYAPYTRRLFDRAGIAAGMRVLDVGCGAGDVSFLAAEIVGSQGSVVGVERDEQAVETARSRAIERRLTNVEFVVGDFREVEGLGAPFDALVGRLVLMYQADPAAAIAAAASHVRAGGVVAFAEMCIGGPATPGRATVGSPPTPAWQQVSQWIYDMHTALGTQVDLGYRLLESFAEAGLVPGEALNGEVILGVGEDAVSRVVDLVRSMLPAIVETGAATEADVDIETLAERLRADTGEVGPVAIWPTVIGAFAHTSR